MKKSGLELFLGSTEAIIMEYMWSQMPAPSTNSGAVKYMASYGKVSSQSSVNTVIRHLIDKGYVKNIDSNRSSFGNRYLPVVTRDEFIDNALRMVFITLDRDFGDKWQSIVKENVRT